MSRIASATTAPAHTGIPRPAPRNEPAPSFEEALASSRRPPAADAPPKKPRPDSSPHQQSHEKPEHKEGDLAQVAPADAVATETPEDAPSPEEAFDAVLMAEVELRDAPAEQDSFDTQATMILRRIMRSLTVAEAPRAIEPAMEETADTSAVLPEVLTAELTLTDDAVAPAVEEAEPFPPRPEQNAAMALPPASPPVVPSAPDAAAPDSNEPTEPLPAVRTPIRNRVSEAAEEAPSTDQPASGAEADIAEMPLDTTTESDVVADPESAPAKTPKPSPADASRIEADTRELPTPAQPAATREAHHADAAPPAPRTVEEHFAERNHDRIVTAMRSEIARDGGRAQIRLDPPHLGRIDLQIEVRDGVISASIQTGSEEATRLLSHSLGQLKASLETQGLSVEKIQVQQAPRQDPQSQADDSPRQQRQGSDPQQQQQEQQRRQMMRRAWERIAARQGIDVEA